MHLFALHGFTGRGSDFTPFAQLVGGSWTCPDLPGHGPTPPLQCSPQATLQTLQKVARQQARSAAPHILLGYSMGARAALQLAQAEPELWDALILISSNPGIEDPVERQQRRTTDANLATRIERDGIASFLEFWQSTPMIRSQQSIRSNWQAAMQTARAAHTPAGLAASLREFGQGSCPNQWPQLNKLKLPTLLITGADDDKYTQIATRMQQTLGTATHTIIPNSGHMPHLESPEESANAILHFLRNIPSPLIA